jgi:hypothetical protein
MRQPRSAVFTTTPETRAPQLLCPECDKPLVYRTTVLSGEPPGERWDFFACRTCGPFEYRHRTRRLRAA